MAAAGAKARTGWSLMDGASVPGFQARWRASGWPGKLLALITCAATHKSSAARCAWEIPLSRSGDMFVFY
jgi:hypothetical protein